MHTASLTKWQSETGGVDRGESCSPSPSPLSPSFRRKRLRKGSTGSTSGGSADKTEEINEITLVATNIVKPEPHIVPQEASEHLRRPINATTDTQGSIDEDQISIMSNMESSTTTTPAQSEGSLQEVGHQSGNVGHGSVSSHPPAHQGHQQKQIGTKHGRLLMRQPRVKKESEPGQRGSPESEPGSPRIGASASTAWSSSSSASSPHITAPNVKLTSSSREQSWDDSVDTSGATTTSNAAAPAPTNLLTVPQPSYLVKQHSHPLLPSQQAAPSSSNYWIQRQHSNPEYPGGRTCSSPKSTDPIPLIKIDEGTPVTASSATRQDLTAKCQISTSRESAPTVPSNSGGGGGIRLVPAELLRSSSAPQTSSTNPHTSASENRTLSREGSSDQRGHCPVQRPGPALGCNHCWNTIDTHGRILRRKTKYHCPECQINLCIVPCFQEFHERPREISPLRPLPKTSSI
ncbi:mucin-12-like isoform X3 [Venturia canescens]|nr:mucin-12-like isoform X3 [Venturia canescens]